jgi:hypothetical protein
MRGWRGKFETSSPAHKSFYAVGFKFFSEFLGHFDTIHLLKTTRQFIAFASAFAHVVLHIF